MKRLLIAAIVLCVPIGLIPGNSALGNGAIDGDAPGMMVSPHTIILGKTNAVTVHTNIPYYSVITTTVTLEGVECLYAWADDRGHLAARFPVADLALQAGEATLTLCGDYKSPGESFAAEDVVRVK